MNRTQLLLRAGMAMVATTGARIVVSGLSALKDDPVAERFSARADAVKPAVVN